jgi:hypothetical protein
MLRSVISAVLAAMLLVSVAPGCKKKEAAPAAEAAAGEAGAVDDLEPSEADKKAFDEEATKEITADNAKAVADELAKEIEADLAE